MAERRFGVEDRRLEERDKSSGLLNKYKVREGGNNGRKLFLFGYLSLMFSGRRGEGGMGK